VAAAAAIVIAACGGSTARPAAVTPTPAPPASSSQAVAVIVAPAPSEQDAGVPIAPDDPTWGDRRAPVTIVEFADLQCPYCGRADATIRRVRELYGPDVVRIVWKHCPLPFHQNARPAAEVATGVRALASNGAFWAFVEAAFSAKSHGSRMDDDQFAAWARQAGVSDVDALLAGLQSHRWGPKVDADLAEAKDVGVQGTPAFFINGVRLVGAQPYEAFREVIDQQLAAARAKVAAGEAPERVYAVLSRENRAAQPPDKDDDDDPPQDTKTVFAVPVGASPVRGPAAAPVTIVEFADYQCAFCIRAEPTLAEIRASYGDKVRFVYRNAPLPFHDRAEPAAEAALEVRAAKGDAAFWAMHDALLDGSSDRDLGDEALAHLAGTFGARPEKVRAAISRHAHAAEIGADEDTADDYQVDATPHFFINGRRLVGAQPKEAFSAIIDEELAKAQALVAAGTKPSGIYDAMIKGGVTPPDPVRVDVKALPSGDPARGPVSARVTIHEFADFQCPYCVRAEPTLKQVAARYGNRVRFVWHDLPLSIHDDAVPAARAAREARAQRGDAAFWALHDRFFADGAKLDRASLDEDARALKLDMVKWAAALDGDAYASELKADQDAAAALGFEGTPTFLVVPAHATTGYVVLGAQRFAKFRKLIDGAIAEAGK
jgi:protein-disulfide isomerase